MGRFGYAMAGMLLVGMVADGPSPPPTEAVTITVEPGERQTFAGFGSSLGNWGRDYQKLSPAERDRLSGLLHGGLKLKSLRLWINLNEYAPTPEKRVTEDFRARYIDSGIVADALKYGVKDLLLAPDNAPESMKVKREGGPQDFALKDESLDAYGDLIAEFLAQIRAETGVVIHATGVQNEPNNLDRIAPEQMPRVVKALRAGLDARGLQAVTIVAPEAANVDGVAHDTLDRLKKDPRAWTALGGIATHSYDMAATEDAAKRIEGPGGGNAKAYWMTEASDVGPEREGDAERGASLASRFLNDMNHRVTHWVHFLGFEVPDPRDNATRILAFTPDPLRLTIFQKFYYYRQLGETFDVGAVFRRSQNSLEGPMTWTYGKKPRLTVAAARNPDGSWGIGLSNFTSENFNAEGSPGQPATVFDATLVIPELAGSGAVTFTEHASNGHLTNANQGVVTLIDGRGTVRVEPLELITLRSGPLPK